MSTPALRRLREAYPQAQITLLTPAKLQDLWEGYSDLDQVIAFGPRDSVFAVGRRLHSEHFDVSVVLPNSHRSALESFLARIPWRLGYGNLSRRLLLTRVVPRRPYRVRMRKRSGLEVRNRVARQSAPARFPALAHHVLDYLHLVSVLGANPAPVEPRLEPSKEGIIQMESLLARDCPSIEWWIGVNAGAAYGPAKRWPAEWFTEVARQLAVSHHCGVMVLGGAGDTQAAGEMTGRLRQAGVIALDLAGHLNLQQLCAAFTRCRLLLTNDTGPMHVAAAVGTPVVVPFGSTSPELTGPGLPFASANKHKILYNPPPCAPCFRRRCPIDFRCLLDISVEQVVAAAREVLATPAHPPPGKPAAVPRRTKV